VRFCDARELCRNTYRGISFWFSDRRPLVRNAMETCVLIPKELSLQAIPVANVQRSNNNRHHAEPEITVMTNVNVPRGTLIYPFQGTVRMDKLDVFSFLDDTDVSAIIYMISYNIFTNMSYIVMI